MNIPAELKFAKTDEWVQVEDDVVTIGISDFAQSQLSDIVYFEFKVDPGDTVQRGAALATVESVKAAADVNSPVTGEVLEVNEAVVDGFEEINQKPFELWFVKIRMADPNDLDLLMTSDEYSTYCENR